MAKRHDRCLSESYRRRCAPASIWCDRFWFLPRLQLDFLAWMNDLNGGGAEDFLHWAVPEEHAVLDAVEESAGLPKELLARSRANCAARREHEFEARSSLARFPGWKSPLLRSAKGDRSPARQHVWVMMRGSVVRPTVNGSGGKGAHCSA